MTDSYNVIFIRDWLEFAIAFLSLFCSSLTLYIIYRLKVWNGNLLLICTLTIFQVLYDINFLFGPSDYYATCVIWNFLDLLGGLGTSFTTNVIAFSMIYIVVRIKSINILQNYKYLFIFMGVIPFVIACMAMFIITPASRDDDKPYTSCVYNNSSLADTIHNIYYWGRLSSIAFNFLAFWYMSFKIRKMGFMEGLQHWGNSLSSHLSSITNSNSMNPSDIDGKPGVNGGDEEEGDVNTTYELSHKSKSSATSVSKPLLTIPEQQTLAVRIIVSRMRFYPLAQAICRSGSAWDEYDNYRYSNNTSSIMASICSPFSGVFYMIIFLVMQPNAWKMCKSIFYDLYTYWFGIPPTISTAPQLSIDSIHLRDHMSLSNIFRMSATLLDDNTLESIINLRSSQDSNSLLDWNPNLTLLMLGNMGTTTEMMVRNSQHQNPENINELGRPNSATVNLLHQQLTIPSDSINTSEKVPVTIDDVPSEETLTDPNHSTNRNRDTDKNSLHDDDHHHIDTTNGSTDRAEK